MLIKDFAPQGNWFVECYHTLTSDNQVRINNGTIRFALGDIFVVITRRPISYRSSLTQNLHVRYWKRGGAQQLAWNNPGKPIETEAGTIKTLFFVPNTNDDQVDKKLRYAKAIVSMKYGITLTWNMLTQYIIDEKGDDSVSESPSYREPVVMFEEDNDVNELIEVSEAVGKNLTKKEQSIALIALSLYHDSMFSELPFDQLIKVWFAIEVLCKSAGKNKKQPVKTICCKYMAIIDMIHMLI